MCVVVVFFFQGLGDHRDLHVLTHSFPTRRSSDLLGLANWPAMRPSFTTGSLEAKVSTTAICSRTRKGSRSAEYTPELQSLMRISYAAFCLKKKLPILHVTLFVLPMDAHTTRGRQHY